MAETNRDNKHLYPLNELDDYKVSSEDPDVRGWDILDRENKRFGTIRDLIVDTDKEKVRYLDVEPSADIRSGPEEGRFLIPIGAAKLKEEDHKVVVNELKKEGMENYPLHTGDVIARDYEMEVVESLNQPFYAGTGGTSDFYNAPLYDETRFYANRKRKL